MSSYLTDKVADLPLPVCKASWENFLSPGRSSGRSTGRSTPCYAKHQGKIYFPGR